MKMKLDDLLSLLTAIKSDHGGEIPVQIVDYDVVTVDEDDLRWDYHIMVEYVPPHLSESKGVIRLS